MLQVTLLTKCRNWSRKFVYMSGKVKELFFQIFGVVTVKYKKYLLQGYEVEMSTGKGGKPKKIIVCSSCARAMRGRYKLERIPGNIDFACSMGSGKIK